MESLNEISRLIARKVLGETLPEEDNAIFARWVEEGNNKTVFERIKNKSLAVRFLKLEQEGYGEKMADRFKETLRWRKLQAQYRKWSLYISGVAAVVLIVTGIFLYMKTETLAVKAEIVSAITPGEVKATLTLPDGRTISIGDTNKERVKHLMDSVYAEPQPVLGEAKRQAYSTLSIPKGGEFFIKLADGSNVWLNSESELRFPETFDQNRRQVFLKGEAFFEVVKDNSHPFIISTNRGDIQVYGTRFCVTDYVEQPFSTVLVEGSIVFRSLKGKETKMQPSQRLVYHSATEQIQVETVDVSAYTAWVDHFFIFHNQSLEEIMTTLSRWYNFDVVFADDSLRNIKFSGRLFRYDNIEVLLDSYEQVAGIKFKIENNNILITK